VDIYNGAENFPDDTALIPDDTALILDDTTLIPNNIEVRSWVSEAHF
jgi:hypothetical protein